jgi:hypothetical protein
MTIAAPSLEDVVSGLVFAYSTVGQGDPYLTITQVFNRAENQGFLEITGLVGSLNYRMDVRDADITKVPTTVRARFGVKTVEWSGTLDMTKHPVKSISHIPGWQPFALKDEFAGAAFFDPLAPVLVTHFSTSEPISADETIARKTPTGIFARAFVAGVVAGGGAAAMTAGTGAPALFAGVGGFLIGAAGSFMVDITSAITDDVEEVEAEPPPDPDVDTTEEPDAGCFAEGTVVALGTAGTLIIDRIVLGDEVASRGEVSSEDGVRRVTRTWRHTGKRTLEVRLDTGEVIRTTPPHRFFTVERGIVAASELQVGDRLQTLSGDPRTTVGIEAGPETTVHNLTVEGLHTFFVGEAAVWVHNDKKTTHEDAPPPQDGDQPDDADDDDSDSSSNGGSSGSPSGGGTAPPPA